MIEYRNRLNYRTILYIYKVRLLYTLLYYDKKHIVVHLVFTGKRKEVAKEGLKEFY
jgi:hypothetical protein